MLGLFCSLCAGAALLLPEGSRRIATFDNLRFLLGEGPPTLAHGVELASRVAPPPALDADALALPLGATRSQKTDHTSLAGRTILLISIDALRADHLGCYGYGRPTSPAMDELAKAGVRYNAAYSPTPHTSYSVTSLMSGKYMRPLLLQDTGHDSELWATLLQTYGYRTAAFYPPAIFFIDQPRFLAFQQKKLGFEYAKVEFAEGEKRLGQVRSYVSTAPPGQPLFVWVHLFGPHEPYVQQPEAHFGDRDVDRYDSEVRAADATVAGLVDIVRKHDPRAVVVLTADHGEEFGDHGGRYHGTSVYDEQVRVPLIISGPDLPKGRVVTRPVQTIDLLPTFLDGLDIVIPPRIRGRSLLADLNGGASAAPSTDPGLAVAETDEYTLLAQGPERLICQRRSGACRLFDIQADPRQLHDLGPDRPERTQALKTQARALAATHGRYETQGLREKGRGWPTAIVLGMSGNADIAPELARLLDDADLDVRRKAAELLFDLGHADQTPALRLALGREEDQHVRSWLGLTLTRLGEGAPLVVELLHAQDPRLRRTAALVLAEQGNDAGETELIRWFLDIDHRPEATALAILKALARIRSEEAVPFLLAQLKDVRLRPAIAQALAQIGDKDARGPLTFALRNERFHSARAPLIEALLDLGAEEELVLPLRHFMGVPDPLPGGLQFALRAGILDQVGGPKATDLRRLRQLGESGVRVAVVVPPIDTKKEQTEGGGRLIVLLRSHSALGGQLLVQAGVPHWGKKSTFSKQPEIDTARAVTIPWPPTPLEAGGLTPLRELSVDLPTHFKVQPGHVLVLEVYAAGDLELRALAVVPHRAEVPPPPPQPWASTTKDEQSEEEDDPHSPAP
jgi:arylsulfatase A-like enzyme